MKFFKILHKPTGMYYKPSKYRSKANLSKRGKVYQTEGHANAAWKTLDGGTYRHPVSRNTLTEEEVAGAHRNYGRNRNVYYHGYETRPVAPEEWTIQEFSITP